MPTILLKSHCACNIQSNLSWDQIHGRNLTLHFFSQQIAQDFRNLSQRQQFGMLLILKETGTLRLSN